MGSGIGVAKRVGWSEYRLGAEYRIGLARSSDGSDAVGYRNGWTMDGRGGERSPFNHKGEIAWKGKGAGGQGSG